MMLLILYKIQDILCLLETWSWSLASSANFLPQSTNIIMLTLDWTHEFLFGHVI